MKIAVLTLPLHNNYGGNLQAYALMKHLKDSGHDPYLIAIQPHRSVQNRCKTVTRQVVGKLIKGNKKIGNPFIIGMPREQSDKISYNSQYFIDTYVIPQTRKLKGKKDLAKLGKENFDAFVVGSDQVWRKAYTNYYKFDFFLDFLGKNKKEKRIAYAASFGVDHWQFNESETKKIKRLIRHFDGIGIREESGVTKCKDFLQAEGKHVLDPTLLLEPNDYKLLTSMEGSQMPDGEMMTYVLDQTPEKKELIQRIAQQGGYRAYTVNPKDKDKQAPIENQVYPPVTDWLKGFSEAKFIVTDSFHGTVFSILFNKPFVVIANQSRGVTRFKSILKRFGLEDRLLLNSSDYSAEILTRQIDWDTVNQKLQEARQDSKSFLKTYLA